MPTTRNTNGWWNKAIAGILIALVSINIGLSIRSLLGQSELKTEIEVLKVRVEYYHQRAAQTGP
jgi:hypothetical protein